MQEGLEDVTDSNTVRKVLLVEVTSRNPSYLKRNVGKTVNKSRASALDRMKKSCMQKVKKIFKTLPANKITLYPAYIDDFGKFCFNAVVLDICSGLVPAHINNSKVPSRLLDEGIYKQDDTIRSIDLIHSNLIDEHIDFEYAKDQVLQVLSNDGYNNFEEFCEANTFDTDYDDDEDR